ncbi:MAG TPA: helix-turn-helix transcriptional regulator [Flavisolibacter sp.]|jgi:transcriptional regulator with XRE-family HTH domain|nr:helix-turn-helix transcriptional regulator [Flavisolibacter sp.]
MQREDTAMVHEGRNVKRIREMLGVKQEALAMDLGISQQAVSQLEQKEALDKEMLEKISEVLKVPVDAIKNFDSDKVIYNISCNFSDNAVNNNAINIQNINPVEKWLEALEENKKLYEQLLKAEREKNVLLERILNEKK